MTKLNVKQNNFDSPQMTSERLMEFGAAWDRRDIDALMAFITDNCIFSASVGSEPGQTYIGKEAVRQGFEKMLKHDEGGESRSGDVWVAGNKGVAEWSYIFTNEKGEKFELRGCDLFEFDGNQICRKDAFRKIFNTHTLD
jgi:ketosteroid isomerase-like protein